MVNQGVVDCLAVSPRGLLLASGSADGRVWLWDLHDLRPLRLLRRHAAGVTCLAWSPDGKLLASGGGDGSLCLWAAPEGELLHLWRGAGPVRSVAFRPGGGLVAGLWELSGVRQWEVPSGNELPAPQGHAGVVECLAFAPDGGLLATGGRDHTVRLWAVPDGRPLGLLAGHTGPVTCLVVSPDGGVLASGSDDRTVELWGLPDGRPLRTLKGFAAAVHALAASPNGQAVVVAAGSRCEVWATELVRLAGAPVGRMTPEDLAWTEEALRDGSLPADERAGLEFIAALARRRKRFDIHLDDAPARIAVGEFDIEIAG
jgi:WD40 repeat protein